MGVITVKSILDRVVLILKDPLHVRWSVDELVGWFNDAQREILTYRPDVFMELGTFSLTTGAKQTLPTKAVQLSSITKNFGSGGTAAVTKVDQTLMDALNPSWQSGRTSKTVKLFMYSLYDPRTFYVYPPQPAGTDATVEALYSIYPTPVVHNAGVFTPATIQTDDLYASSLVDFILYRAYSKDAENQANTALATAHYSAFMAPLQGSAQSTVAVKKE